MKVCRTCEIEKPAREYYRHKQMKDGRLNICIVCTRARVGRHREKNIEDIRAYDRKRGATPDRVRNNCARMSKYRKKYPVRYAAKSLLNNAVRDGKITKPTICSKCKEEARQIEAHHHDYYKPLEVEWLCSVCHKQEHRKGE